MPSKIHCGILIYPLIFLDILNIPLQSRYENEKYFLWQTYRDLVGHLLQHFLEILQKNNIFIMVHNFLGPFLMRNIHQPKNKTIVLLVFLNHMKTKTTVCFRSSKCLFYVSTKQACNCFMNKKTKYYLKISIMIQIVTLLPDSR